MPAQRTIASSRNTAGRDERMAAKFDIWNDTASIMPRAWSRLMRRKALREADQVRHASVTDPKS